MRNTEINFKIDLDENSYPEKITWRASDAENVLNDSKAISLNVWDHNQQNTLRIDLWTKEMMVDDMKKFFIDCLGGLAQTIQNSTGDTYLSGEVNALCDKLAKYIASGNNEGRDQEGQPPA